MNEHEIGKGPKHVVNLDPEMILDFEDYDQVTFLDRCTMYNGECVVPYALDKKGCEINVDGFRIIRDGRPSLCSGCEVFIELVETRPGVFVECHDGVMV